MHPIPPYSVRALVGVCRTRESSLGCQRASVPLSVP
ncbi:hypothetical protein CPAR01_15504 [Colletotrichum paranaense]|uniref:Uncharacterized protein n=1 Tax=Colletotrichum paranaense TaxID=1914294 RepID=A0ABQ9S0Q2_9PEZI|nr:uncharacterized protein CPAR01_15504 [Colletotrichum paranaense]KAK1520011.1 hypothetical protein CPAR01_15504 [Colletotrichum paranaense]